MKDHYNFVYLKQFLFPTKIFSIKLSGKLNHWNFSFLTEQILEWFRNFTLTKSLFSEKKYELLNILGLAVLSMCANLAASELRSIFMKIHYFGRKISRRRQQALREKRAVSSFSSYCCRFWLPKVAFMNCKYMKIRKLQFFL